ncbi:MAG TPA: DNA/RNA non-specific endonuclease [Pyrinomonadaceae bacterium]|nr:DNA/RNA non-specific endonuclease [Pyrinomonadaceae bacterium]
MSNYLPPFSKRVRVSNRFTYRINSKIRAQALPGFLLALVLSVTAVFTFVRSSSAVTNGGIMSALDSPLTENFDALANSGTGLPWGDNSTIPGWYSNRLAYNAGTGSSNTGALYSFGVANTNPLTDRALGSVASGGTGTVFQAVKLTNSTGVTITSLDVAYVGEQWRNGGNTTAQNLLFSYQVANAGGVPNITTGSWTAFSALNFTSVVNTATAAALDGNNPTNRTAKTATITANVAAGQEIWFRWQDSDDGGNDHGLAIDDFSVTPHGTVGDAAPFVASTVPTNTAVNVAANSNISITFSEAVSITGNWFQIACGISGTRLPGDTVVTGGPVTFTIDPNSEFAPNEQCTATVFATQVTDQDVDDPPDNMLANAVFTFSAAGPPADPGSLVISQVYGGGGNSGATIKNDFIEIINHTGSPISLNGWSVQYAGATGSSWAVTPLGGSLAPGQYYLIQEAAGAGGTVNLIPDASGDISMSGTAGKVALVNSTTALTDACPSDPSVIDFVGYGTTASCFEGSGPTPAPSNTTAVLRATNGCTDTDDNADDFAPDTPNPRNTSSPTNNCAVFSGVGSANPASVQPGDSSTLTVNVTPGSNPTSTGITVVADLSSIGGSVNQSFTGNGNSFTFLATVAIGTTPGQKSLPVTITDAQSRTANTAINLTVLQPPPAADHLVISQVYGGGGNSSAAFKNDFVELYNPGIIPFDLTGWSVQYASFNGSGWGSNKQPLGGVISPGEYYLIKLAGGATGAEVQAANVDGVINLSGSTGKVALVSSFQPLSGTCPLADPNLVDFVGYGSSASTSGFCYEGTAPAPGPSGNNQLSVLRKNGGNTDTNNNANDFQTGSANPRRTAPIVELGPNVLTTDPASNGFNVPHDASISVSFTEPVNVVGDWYNIACADLTTHNDATVVVSNSFKSYLIIPNVNFGFGQQCTVTINKDNVHDQDLDDSGPNTDTPPSDYSWTFSVVGAGAPAPYPPSVHLTMGNPSNAVADVFQPNNYLLEKPSYSLSYNRDKGTPNWVSWHLEPAWFGSLARFDTFRPDPAVPPQWYRVLGTDYSGSGFDRGHMTPNADRDNENRIPINQETYLMTNMVPQAPDNNQGPWASFENYLRSIVTPPQNNEVYIVSGPLGEGGTGSNGARTTIAAGHVTVPEFTWKVVLVIPLGDNDVSRVTAATRTIGILMPNTQGIRFNPWESYITTVDHIEELTGYDFFANVPDAIENAIEGGTNGDNPPGTENQAVTTAEDTSTSITLTAVSPIPSTSFTFTIVDPPAHGMLTGVGANPSYQPNPDFNGTDSFTFKANDGANDSNTSTVSITVSAVNDAPTLNAIGNQTVYLGNTLSFTAVGSDIDLPSQTLSYNLTGTVPSGATIDSSSGAFSWTPTAAQGGQIYTLTVRVTDNGSPNLYAEEQITVGVAYTWSNLLAPVQAGGVYKAGRTIPIKFHLTGASAGVTNAVIKLLLFKVTNDVVGDPVDVESTSAATTDNLFHYDSGQYIFNLNTSGLGTGTYQLQVDMGDGVLRVMNVSLR